MAKPVAVQDANIFIDLEIAGLFDLWIQLGIETHTTNFIVAQLEDGGHQSALSYILSEQIHAHALDSEELGKVLALQEAVTSGPDLSDCSVLYLAEQLDARLLTNDNPLRKEGKGRHIEVHGTLWIFDQLIAGDLLLPAIARAKLQLLLKSQRYLPRAECQARLSKWERTK